MKKMRVGALLGAPLVAAPTLIGAASGAATVPDTDHQILQYGLAAEALVMIPAMNQDWLDLSKELYLVPNGFAPDGTATFLQVPETNDLNASISGATQILVEAIAQRWNDGEFSSTDPLYVFGYSQADVAAGLAAEQLHAQYPDMPLDALHFVLVGDSAAEGGFLSGFMPTLLQWIPESWHADVINMVYQFAELMHVDSVIGLVTPSDLYTTDVYSLSSDGFANWDNGQQMAGMFSDHLAYLGLTPTEIAGATEDVIGNTTYHMIDSADVNMFQALLNSLDMIIGGVLAWF
ncbi:PE-PPE domain-containing protein [Mycobacterium sp. P7213]|uniref:PE-PPE domain-containing protein n=1 Tax=Mycobacterium sp. P7213 TaxID=2478465 RepID=UPI000F63EF1D|nr:PE-PPE domain-containing protein [Mycobacterium sp. P7213]